MKSRSHRNRRSLIRLPGPFYRRCDDVTAFAALRMTSSTRAGLESMGTWLLAVSTVMAPMRFATERCSSGCTVRSPGGHDVPARP